MSANSSSSNASLTPSHISSSDNMYSFLLNCLNDPAGMFMSTSITVASILILLPLCIFVLYLGLQRLRQQRSDTTMSHSDVFTCHMVVMELLSVLGSIISSCGAHAKLPQMIMVGFHLFFMNSTGQIFFHILTCVERYLAVVHPIIYLSLRKAKGIRIRNITIGCVWLLCFTAISDMSIESYLSNNIITYCIMAFALTIVSFCSLSVLYVLIRPGPGEGGGGRQQVDQSKLRAFYIIMAILGVLVFRFGGVIISFALFVSLPLGESERCSLWFSSVWFGLPSSLVLPLLFLHRAGKLLCCKNNVSGQGTG